MPKETGLAFTTLSVDDDAGVAQDLRSDVRSFNFATPRAVQDVTGVDKSAIERLHLLADFSVELSFVFDDATSNSVHDAFKNLANVRTVALAHSGQTLNNECLFTDYAMSRGEDGSLTGTAPAVLANGTVPTWS